MEFQIYSALFARNISQSSVKEHDINDRLKKR